MWHNYFVARSLDEALALLAEHGPRARIVAGGTDLLIELERNIRPEVDTLIDISRLPSLDAIALEGVEVRLGPLTRHNDCVASEIILRHARPLAQACWEVGAPQIRNRATVAGNLITASPANDTITPLIALEASVTLQSVRGERRVSLSEFYTGVRQTVMAPDELLTRISFRPMAEGDRGMFIKLGLRKAQAISVMNVAAIVNVDPWGRASNSRLALGAVAPTIVRAREAEAGLEGAILDNATIEAAALAAAEAVRPIDDIRATAGYRAGMVQVVVRRALEAIRTGETHGWMPDQPVMLWGERIGRPSPVFNDSPASRNGRGGHDPIITTVNGLKLQVSGSNPKSLMRLLREDLGLTGTKEGCAEGECGACTVFLDGAAVMSCLVPAPQAHGAEITTIEGLAAGGEMHPVQAAFVAEGAVQCGYCTPGLVMAGAKVIEERAHPTRWEAQQAIAGNLCRCTGYYKVLNAIARAGRLTEEAAY